jgi:hypothetical protein
LSGDTDSKSNALYDVIQAFRQVDSNSNRIPIGKDEIQCEPQYFPEVIFVPSRFSFLIDKLESLPYPDLKKKSNLVDVKSIYPIKGLPFIAFTISGKIDLSFNAIRQIYEF